MLTRPQCLKYLRGLLYQYIPESPNRILVVGNSEGILPVMFAQKYPQCHVTGISTSLRHDTAQARDLAEACDVGGRMRILKKDLHAFAQSGPAPFDAIVFHPHLYGKEARPDTLDASMVRAGSCLQEMLRPGGVAIVIGFNPRTNLTVAYRRELWNVLTGGMSRRHMKLRVCRVLPLRTKRKCAMQVTMPRNASPQVQILFKTFVFVVAEKMST